MATLLDFMAKVGNATPDDAVDDIMKMADPAAFDTKVDMQDHFRDTLGYDPITYFPQRYLESKLRELEDIAPFSVREQLVSKREAIVSRSLECIGDLDTSILNKVLESVVEYTTGWKSEISDGVTVDKCIAMSLFGDGYSSIDDEADAGDGISDLDDDEDEEYDPSEDTGGFGGYTY